MRTRGNVLPVVALGVGLALLLASIFGGRAAASALGAASPPRKRIRSGVEAREVEALARIMWSEAGTQGPEVHAWVGWTARNRAKKEHRSIASMVSRGTIWLPQGVGPMSAAEAPPRLGTGSGLWNLAEEIFDAPEEDDPTNSADAFFEPKLQDFLHSSRARCLRYVDAGIDPPTKEAKRTCPLALKTNSDAATIRKSWMQDRQPIAVVGKMEFWKKRTREA